MCLCVCVCVCIFILLVFSEFPGFVIFCLSLIWEVLSRFYFKYILCSVLFSTFDIPVTFMLYLSIVSHSFWIFCSDFGFVLVFHFLFSLHFTVGSFYRRRLILFSAISSILMNSLKTFFISVTVFLFLAFPFDSFFKFAPFCQHYTSVLVCYFYYYSP